MLTPLEIQNKEFNKSFRGYSEEEVNEFMMQISREYEVLYRDNREMKEALEQLREKLTHYEKMESTMNSTLMMAQQTAEELRSAARKEAELIVKQAEQQKAQMEHDTIQSLRDGQERYERVRQDVAVFRAKMESLLCSHSKLLEEMELPECRDCIISNDTVTSVLYESKFDVQAAPSDEPVLHKDSEVVGTQKEDEEPVEMDTLAQEK